MSSSENEIVEIERTTKVCPMCEDYARRNAEKSVVVMCCEGPCLRGEVARRASNLLSHRLAPENHGAPLSGRLIHQRHWTAGTCQQCRQSHRSRGLLSGMCHSDDEGRRAWLGG